MLARTVRRSAAIGAVLALTLTGCAGHPTPATSQSTAWPPAAGRGPCAVQKQTDVPARMRDGVVLRADVYRPKTSDAVPVILMRTQYGKTGAQVEPSRYQTPDWFASHCYLVVVQDIRGQGASGGTFTEFAHDQDDGYDSVEWAAGLPGSNGKVGMYGSSYVGATQWLAATTAPPHLVTIVPANTASDYYDGWTYEGGEFRLAFILPWAMGLATTAAENRGDTATVQALKAASADPTRWLDFRPFKDLPPMQPASPTVAPWYFDWIRHSTRDDYWARWSIRDRYPNVRVPVLDFEGWYDAFLAGGVENFAGMVDRGGTPDARANQRLVIGPWDHVDWGRPDSDPAPLLKAIGAVANSPINELMLNWYDHYLKGQSNGVGGAPRVDYFLMGANRWKSATAWPLPQYPVDHLLPVRGGRHVRPQGRTEHIAAAGRTTCGRLHLRPGLSCPEHGRALLLRRPVRTAGAVRPDHRRAAVRCPDLQHRAADRGHRGDRPADRHAVGVVVGARYRLHRQTRGGAPRRRGDQSKRRHHPHLVPGLAVPSDSDHARSAVPRTKSPSGQRVTSSAPATASGWRSPAATTRSSPRTRTPVRRSARTRSRGRRRRRSCMTRHTRRRSRCPSFRAVTPDPRSFR